MHKIILIKTEQQKSKGYYLAQKKKKKNLKMITIKNPTKQAFNICYQSYPHSLQLEFWLD